MTSPLADHASRERIASSHDETLFVEAGAGSGKTASLVTRVVSLIGAGVPVTSIAAITFTEAAAAELRTRVRQALERVERGDDVRGIETTDVLRRRAAEALDVLDEATICTLHAFAQRLLMAAPVEAGLPPVVEINDDISSAIAFDARWRSFERRLLDDESLAALMRTAMVLQIGGDKLQRLAGMLDQNWDLVEEAAADGVVDAARNVVVDPAALPVHDIAEAWGRVLELCEECTTEDDALYEAVQRNVVPWFTGLLTVRDDPYATLEHLGTQPSVRGNAGNKNNWPDGCKDRMHTAIAEARDRQKRAYGDIVDAVLTRLGGELAAQTLDAADARRHRGQLEFHDLLVLARRVLRSDERVRRRFHERYRTLLIDEFQDTDPIQVELAVRIAADPGHDTETDWRHVDVEPGRLFFVGDPKQSIYRFRRADIDLFMRTAEVHAAGVTTLSVNFRTTKPILDFVNAVFDRMIVYTDESSDGVEHTAQPDYVPLDHHRAPIPDDPGPPVLLLGDGTPHDSAELARSAEARDVVGALQRARDEGWLVAHDDPTGDGEIHLPCRWSDMTVLLPSRTSLPHLRAELDAQNIPYRIESGTLVFGTTEVTDLLSVLRAIDDPGDHIAVVGALRSPAYGCGDDELHRWVRDHGSVSYLGPAVADASSSHGAEMSRVEAALADLRERHRRAPFETVSQVVESVIRERRLMELSLAGGRHRDSWRLYRVVVEHARAYADHESGGLRDFLAWAVLQRDDKVRATSPVLPEADVDAVRILTIHGSKGLEFGLCAVSGLSGQDPTGLRGPTVQFRPDGGFDVQMKSGMETTRFIEVRTLEDTMDLHERIRLLYVALTRARDHLIVSTHHTQRAAAKSHGGRLMAQITEIEAAADHQTLAPRWTSQADETAQTQLDLGAAVLGDPADEPMDEADALAEVGVPVEVADPDARREFELARAEWNERRNAVSVPRSNLTATGLARRAGELVADDEDAPEPEAEPWRRGRAGTSVGSAVHAVLQHADMSDPTGSDLAGLARWQATVEGIPDAVDEIEAKARSAISSPLVRRAVASGRWRREVHVGVPLTSPGAAHDLVFEGFIDLLFDDGDGLVVVDYKTDSVSDEGSIAAALERYTPQAAAYAVAVEEALGRPVVAAHFLFLKGDDAIDAPVRDLDAATAAVRALLAATASG